MIAAGCAPAVRVPRKGGALMLDVERRGEVAYLTLERPEVGNALNPELATRMVDALDGLARETDLRAVVITGAGTVFCAGADLNWMRRMRGASFEANLQDARQAGRLFAACFRFPRPVIARVNGPARGGGVGIVAACDFAVSAAEAHFAFSEVRLGLVPAVIAPYVVRKLGPAAACRVFLTGETFDAAEAKALGLVDRVVPRAELDEAVEQCLRVLHQCGPQALGSVKELVREVDPMDIDRLLDRTAEILARVRAGEEACEGMAAFFEKRRPRWAL